MTKPLEIWRTKHSSAAYQDQTGQSHSGYVVLERILVHETEERFDVNDGYAVHKNLGRVCISDDGRRFKVYPETVSYSGGLHVIPEVPATEGFWERAPYHVRGYVHPDGTGPVEHLQSSSHVI